MNDNWMIDVLGDLKTFAQENGMHRLARQLDEAQVVALTETSSLAKRQHLRVVTDNDDGTVYRRTGTRKDA